MNELGLGPGGMNLVGDVVRGCSVFDDNSRIWRNGCGTWGSASLSFGENNNVGLLSLEKLTPWERSRRDRHVTFIWSNRACSPGGWRRRGEGPLSGFRPHHLHHQTGPSGPIIEFMVIHGNS